MKARLLDRDRDFAWKWALHVAAELEARQTGRRWSLSPPTEPPPQPPWNVDALTADLALPTLLNAMARGDACIYEVARRVVLGGVQPDLETIRYRQGVLQDCLTHPEVVRALYAIVGDAMQSSCPDLHQDGAASVVRGNAQRSPIGANSVVITTIRTRAENTA